MLVPMSPALTATIFYESDLKEYVEDDILHLSTAQHLESDDSDMPFCIIGDYFFPLCNLVHEGLQYKQRVHDHHQKIFNYRFSRARCVEENAFGILANRFGCLLNRLITDVETA